MCVGRGGGSGAGGGVREGVESWEGDPATHWWSGSWEVVTV